MEEKVRNENLFNFFDFFDFAVNLPRNGMRVNPRTFDKLIGDREMMKTVLAGLLAAVMVVAGCAESDSGGSGDSGEGPEEPAGPGGGADTGVELNLNTLYLGVDKGINDSATLIATVFPADADQAVTWASSNEDVAKLVNGVVTSVGTGEATITATAKDGGGSAECRVKVESVMVKAEVILTPEQLGLAVGEFKTLALTVNSSADADKKQVQWMFSDPGVAKEGAKTGDVSGVADGKAKVTVTAVYGGSTATCEVTVQSGIDKVDSVSLDPSQLFLMVGDTAELAATLSPATAADPTVTWTSDKKDVATVEDDGKVTCVADGDATITVTITVTTTSGNKTAECAVTVVPAVFVVADTDGWIAALKAISSVADGTGVKPRAFEIQITKDFSAPGITPAYYNITGAYKEVELTGSGTVSLSGPGSLIATDATQKFVIDGPTLKGITTNTYPLVYVGSGSTVELTSGAIEDNYNTSSELYNDGAPRGSDGHGGGVFVDGGTFTMKAAGTISGNQAAAGFGGGVYIRSGTFTMEDGSITGNTASADGGGVFIYSGGTFTMTAGTITENTAGDPGDGNGVFNAGGTYNGPGSGTVQEG
jgi:uncharacterized protein YjdB